ncbi:MAG: ThuA domain-containing protein [Armatimonadetes bacterium]|nr:ThuA domain-containing protein [Armatimonadota bacterium]
MKTRTMLLLVVACTVGLQAAQPTADEASRIEAAAPTVAPAKPKAPRRVLVFSRNEGFDHTAIGVGALAIDTLGRRTGAFAVVHSTDLGVLTAEGLKPYDAIVFNNGYAFKLEDPKARAALLAFVRSGKGVVGIHAASANFEGWAEGTELMGAKFHSHPWTPTAEWPVRNEQPGHPLNAAFGGQSFRLRDEIYTFTEFHRERARVLLSLDLSDTATGAVAHPHPYVPISWVYPLGRGRVFFCSLGHQHEVFWNAAYLKHLLAGIQYALGDLPAPDAPDAGAVARLVSSANAAEQRDSMETLDRLTAVPAQRLAAEKALLADIATAPLGDRLADLAESLSKVASNASLATLTPWLLEAEHAHAARRVLQRLGTAEATAALRAALAKAKGALAAGLASSLADLGDASAVPLIKPLLADADPAVVSAALLALGRLRGPVAAEALLAARPPAALATVHDDALANCASGLAAGAEALYDALAAEGKPARTRVLGLAGLVGLRSTRAVRLAADFLESGDEVLSSGAARMLDRIPGEPVVARAVAAYAKLPTSVQAPLLANLGRRRAADAVKLALAALGSDQPALRQAAVGALGASGQVAAILPLAQFAARSEREERLWALNALAGLRGAGVDAAMAKAAGEGEPATRAMLLGVVTARRQPDATALLLRAAADPEPTVAVEALRGLGRIGGAGDMAPLVKLLVAAREERVSGAAGDAVVALARRQTDRDATLKPVLAALAGASAEARAALLAVLAECGGKAAVAALNNALTDPDAAVRAAALAGLADTIDDPAAAPALLVLAKASEGATRVTATRGWLRVLALAAAADAEGVVRSLAQSEALLARAEERRQALGVLRWCRVPSAMTLAAKWLDQPDTLGEAVATLRHLAAPQRGEGRALAAVTGPEAVAALDRLGAMKDAHLPKPWRCDDLGDVTPAGSAAFADGKWTLKAAGADFYGPRDGGFMLWQRRGDCTVVAKVNSLVKTDIWTKAGVMVRASLTAGSPYVAVMVSGNPQGVIQSRPVEDAETAYEYIPATPPSWVRLQRLGNRFVCAISADGKTWQTVGDRQLQLPAEAYVGFALSSHNNGTLTTAGVEGLEITAP